METLGSPFVSTPMWLSSAPKPDLDLDLDLDN